VVDNVVLDPGTGGDTIAADDVSGVKYQLVQLVVGSDGGAKSLVTGSTPLPVGDAGGSITVDGTVTANLAPTTSGGLSVHRTLSAASTNATSVKASAGQVYGWYVTNSNSSPRYVKLYDKASAPTVGSDTPKMTILVPGSGGANVEFSMGIPFPSGIAFAMTTGAADADTGAVASNEVILNLLYK
jgi:hypothetical protein